MKVLVSGGRTNTLEDIQAAIAAAAKAESKPGGKSKMPARVTIEDMKAWIVRAVRKQAWPPLIPTFACVCWVAVPRL